MKVNCPWEKCKYNIKEICTKEELYIEFICQLFNEYMQKNQSNILNWDFIITTNL